ncbi:hypothetical protein TNCV_795191 [Trichonephila clavipes]|nr:hypothetical protein TNCV_795191 [Trichonephila clavipes]
MERCEEDQISNRTTKKVSNAQPIGTRRKGSSQNIIDADSDEENEVNNAAPVPMSSEMRNIMKSMHSYLDAHTNGEVNNKMEDIGQFDAKKDNAKKYSRLFS